MRGEGAAPVADDAKIVAASCPSGEISVLVHPPLDDPEWRFEARVWITEAAAGSPAVVGLVHDDHVLVRHEVRDGQTLRFAEIVPDGWTLEIHMPDGETMLLDDPFHAD